MEESSRSLNTQLQSVKQLDIQYQQLFQDCQRYQKECLKFHQQAEKEKSHLKTRFKCEGEDENMIRLILYGQPGHGKSTLGNRLCNDTSDRGNKGPFTTGGGAKSVTHKIKKNCIEKNTIYGYGLSVTDQPGAGDKKGKDRLYANDLVEYLRGIGHINAIGLVKTYQPPRFEGSHHSMLLKLQKILGKDMWKHVVIILTHTPPEIQDTEEFKNYCQEFRAEVIEELQLDEQNAPLPIIGIELHNLENCQKQLPRLVNETLASLLKFDCENLKSPLNNLLKEKEDKVKEFKSKFKELLKSEEFLVNLDNAIDQTEQEIAERDQQYTPMYQKVSRNLSKKIECGWNKNNDHDDYDHNNGNNNLEGKTDEEDNINGSNYNMDDVPIEMEGDNLTWSCSSCTYPNHPASKNCEMCEQSRLTE